MIKSPATKIRIASRKDARRLFDRSTREGKEAYREFLRGLLTEYAWEIVKREMEAAE